MRVNEARSQEELIIFSGSAVVETRSAEVHRFLGGSVRSASLRASERVKIDNT